MTTHTAPMIASTAMMMAQAAASTTALRLNMGPATLSE